MRATITVPRVEVGGEDVPDDTLAWWECRLALDFERFERVEGMAMFLSGPESVLEEVPVLFYSVRERAGMNEETFIGQVRHLLGRAEVAFGEGRVHACLYLEENVAPGRSEEGGGT